MSTIRSPTYTATLEVQGHEPVMMPIIGLGTYKIYADELQVAVPAAIDHGYRLIDTAQVYKNEEAIGGVLGALFREGKIRRADLFITSKIATYNQGYELARKSIEESLHKLGTDYMDLFLVHWPGAAGHQPGDPENARLRRETWLALEEAVEAGKIRAIGVSNYQARHLEEMRQYARIMPSVNQIELHPMYYPSEIIEWCHQNKVAVQAYSSLARGILLAEGFLAKWERIGEMQKLHSATASQIFLRWALQSGFCIIPKSVHADRIRENIDLFRFSLSPAEMAYIDAIRLHEGTKKVCWDSAAVA